MSAGHFYDPGFLQGPELADLYHYNALAARGVEFKPKEMFRKGYAVQVPDKDGESDLELAEDIEEYGKALKLNELFLESWIWGRLFGGSILIIGADDKLDPSLPLNEKNIESIKFLNCVDKRFVYAQTYYTDPLKPNFGKPETYMVTNTLDGPLSGQRDAVSIIHESRVIRFDGSPVEIIKRRTMAGWTLSILQRPYDIMRAFDTSYQALANLMVDSSQAVFKIQGLLDMIAGGGAKDMQTRMALVDMTRSAGRAVVLDKDGEEFERKATTLTGYPESVDRIMQLVAMAFEIPVTLLFGRSPAGENATGDADFRAFYDTIASEQNNFLKPLLMRLYTLICLAKDGPTGGKVPDKLDLHFHSLWQLTETEQATLEKTIGDRDVAYVTAGILLPEEVALSRFRKGKFSPDTEIDVEAREKSMAAELDFSVQAAEAKAEAGPPAPQDPRGEPENKALPAPGPGSGKPGETS